MMYFVSYINVLESQKSEFVNHNLKKFITLIDCVRERETQSTHASECTQMCAVLRSWQSKSDSQAWKQGPLPAEPSCPPC